MIDVRKHRVRAVNGTAEVALAEWAAVVKRDLLRAPVSRTLTISVSTYGAPAHKEHDDAVSARRDRGGTP